MKNFLNQTGDRRGKPKTGEVGWWKPDPVGSMKNLPTQTGDGGGKPNNQFDGDNFILLADRIQAMRGGGALHLIRCERREEVKKLSIGRSCDQDF